MPRTLFISDLHLDPSRPGTLRALDDFLGANTDCEALYILGDLFEAWVGDDDDTEFAASMRDMLARFSASGPRLYLMVGNRDFLMGETLCRDVGAALLEDPTVIDLYGTPTLLMHGDSLCTADEAYQAFRQTARDPAWQAQLLAQSLDDRRQLARDLRSASVEASSNKAEDIMDVTPSEVEAVMREHGVEQLIHGHTHRPACHEEAFGVRWVLGDWDEFGWVIEADSNNINLNKFNILD